MTIIIIIGAILALICGLMAKNRGRNIPIAFVLGFFFGIFAVIGYAIAGDSQDKKDARLAEIIRKSKE